MFEPSSGIASTSESERLFARRRAWRLHLKAIALMVVLAVATPMLDRNFRFGLTGWDALANLVTDVVWIAVGLNALLSTLLVAIFAKRAAIALVIELVSPVIVMASSFLLAVILSPSPRARAPDFPPPTAAATCLTSLDRWSWSEPDRVSAKVELEVTTPGPATVEIYAHAEGLDTILLTMREGATRELPAGRSSLALELERLEPGRPSSWGISFRCIRPWAFVRYESGEIDHIDTRMQEMVRGLPEVSAAPPPPKLADDEYDLFVWADDRPGFVLRRAAEEPLDPSWSAGRKIQSPMEALRGELSRLGHGKVAWWPTPNIPNAAQVRTVQAACREAGVSLLMPSRFPSPAEVDRDASP